MTKKMIQHTLANGLTVCLLENHSAPVISHWIWYRVGSRNESAPRTGISHFLEHMQFKGTPKHPASTLDKAISRTGGHWNAFTYLDWTAYFQTLPADNLSLALEIESDRMINALHEANELESERTVVISEREGCQNDPSFRLQEAICKAAFCRHAYSTEIIGEMEDIRAISREDLHNWYQTHYCPNNAVLSIAGDFEAEQVLEQIDKAYSSIPAGKIPEDNILPEDPIPQAQTIRQTGADEGTLLYMAWPAPAASDTDIYSLALLDSILSGPSSLNMFGGGAIFNKTSRLYPQLVQSGLTAGFSGGYSCTIDPYLYQINTLMNSGCDPLQAADTIQSEIASIINQGIRPEELAKAQKQARASFAYSAENITNQAYWMGYASMFDNINWYQNYLGSLAKVTAEDIQNAARKYLSPEHCITAIYTKQG